CRTPCRVPRVFLKGFFFLFSAPAQKKSSGHARDQKKVNKRFHGEYLSKVFSRWQPERGYLICRFRAKIPGLSMNEPSIQPRGFRSRGFLGKYRRRSDSGSLRPRERGLRGR